MMNVDKKVSVQMSESEGPDDRVHFKTSDIAFAATLRTAGHNLVRIDKNERTRGSRAKKTTFVFMKAGVQDDLLKYTNNSLPLDAKSLLDNYRNLKAASLSKGMA